MEIYLDNAATTKPLHNVMKMLEKEAFSGYGNPSSLHRKGLETEKKIKEARRNIAREINGKYNDIYFTSGGTESNNLALIGFFTKNFKSIKPFRCVTLKTEHKSILKSMDHILSKGANVQYVHVDKNGLIDLVNLEMLLKEGVDLLSVSHVNNETGVIQPIEKIGKLFKKYYSAGYFHVDGVQSFCKIPLNVMDAKIDALSISAHKIHGLKGTGVLYLRDKNKVNPLFFGGAQEGEVRPGTENFPGIIGLDAALKELGKSYSSYYKEVADKKRYFMENILETIDHVSVNGIAGESGSPYILNLSFLGVKSEVLLHSLESDGIYVSSGSACNAKKSDRSHVLEAMNLNDHRIDSAIRFSFSPFTTYEELDETVEVLRNHVESLRRIMMR